MISIPAAQQTIANSTTYIDHLGLQCGLTRLTGETSFAFAERIRRAARLERKATYQGLVNELALQFGYEVYEAISIDGPSDLLITVTLAGVEVVSASQKLNVTVPLATVDSDGFWDWMQLSDVVAALNQQSLLSAQLVGDDAPALQLVRQANSVLVVAESIDGQTVRLANAGLVVGSESFNKPVPAYDAHSETSILSFASPVPKGTKITYRFVAALPYQLIASPVVAMSMLDPAFQTLAVTNGQMTYQVKEMVTELLQRDGSYWTV